MAARNFLELAEQKVGTSVPISVNEKRIFKKLDPSTEREYQKQLNKWEEFVKWVTIKKKWPSATVHDVKALKYFMYMQGAAIIGTNHLNACVETVRNYWNRFTSAWAHEYEAIRKDIVSTVTNYIYGELKEELKLLNEKKPRRYANGNHFKSYADAYWGPDWKEYDHPSTRLNDWDLFLVNIYCSARIGDYIESTNRKGSGRGLKFRDMKLICFWNSHGEPELSIQRTKDAKNMSNDPKSKKPKNTISEGRVEAPLYTNSVLFTLARLLSRHAFRDHDTIESILQVVPPKKMNSITIAWRDDILEEPFYCKVGRDTDIETANSFHARNTESGIRACLPEPPTTHDWRAYVLHLIGSSMNVLIFFN